MEQIYLSQIKKLNNIKKQIRKDFSLLETKTKKDRKIFKMLNENITAIIKGTEKNLSKEIEKKEFKRQLETFRQENLNLINYKEKLKLEIKELNLAIYNNKILGHEIDNLKLILVRAKETLILTELKLNNRLIY